ncbi:MAG: hypothetical protein ACTMIR_07880 [Cellulomonadaceae bacterium]
MSSHAIDVAGVAQVTRSAPADLSDAASAVTSALDGAAEASRALGSMAAVRDLFDAHSTVFTGGQAQVFAPDVTMVLSDDTLVTLPGHLADGYAPQYIGVE